MGINGKRDRNRDWKLPPLYSSDREINLSPEQIPLFFDLKEKKRKEREERKEISSTSTRLSRTLRAIRFPFDYNSLLGPFAIVCPNPFPRNYTCINMIELQWSSTTTEKQSVWSDGGGTRRKAFLNINTFVVISLSSSNVTVGRP